MYKTTGVVPRVISSLVITAIVIARDFFLLSSTIMENLGGT
ncbi:hypothetical protein IGJ76_000973 [Enterococcus sp. DIV0175]